MAIRLAKPKNLWVDTRAPHCVPTGVYIET